MDQRKVDTIVGMIAGGWIICIIFKLILLYGLI